MNGPGRPTAQGLREAFDASFIASPMEGETDAREGFLTIRVSGDPYALALSEIVGVHHGAAIAPIAGIAGHLLGIAGIGGHVAPVYDLAAWLGGARAESAPWIARVHARWPVAFAFERLERHIRPAPDASTRLSDPDSARPFVGGVLRTGDDVRPLIHLASIVDAISKLVARAGPRKER